MTVSATVGCILVAGGRGERLGGDQPKAFVELAGQALVVHALRTALSTARVNDVVLVVPAGYESHATSHIAGLLAAPRPAGSRTFKTVVGGATRQESVARGLAALADTADIVLVHDVARCLAPPELYDRVVDEVRSGSDAVVPGLPVVDTLKRVDDTGTVQATLDRSGLRTVQTPQGFRRDVLARAHAEARRRGDTDAADDASLVELLGLPVQMAAGHEEAFKITRPLDLVTAEAVLARRLGSASAPGNDPRRVGLS